MGRRNSFQLDYGNITDIIEKLDKAGAELEKVLTEALEEIGEEITQDTIEALAKPNLPAKGIYSTGATVDSVIKNPKVEKSGSYLEIAVGFDKTDPESAGEWLITGTPNMDPDRELNAIYTGQTYERKKMKKVEAKLQKALDDIVGG